MPRIECWISARARRFVVRLLNASVLTAKLRLDVKISITSGTILSRDGYGLSTVLSQSRVRSMVHGTFQDARTMTIVIQGHVRSVT